jgi:hypothetical protein
MLKNSHSYGFAPSVVQYFNYLNIHPRRFTAVRVVIRQAKPYLILVKVCQWFKKNWANWESCLSVETSQITHKKEASKYLNDHFLPMTVTSLQKTSVPRRGDLIT